MNGIPLREIDEVICPLCHLCRGRDKTGFEEGSKPGICRAPEIIIA